VGIKFGLDLLVDPENVGVMILRNNGWLLQNYTVFYSRRQNFSGLHIFQRTGLLEGLGIHGLSIRKWVLQKEGRRAWTDFICLKIGCSSELLWTRSWNCGFHKRKVISEVTDGLLTSQQGALMHGAS
jgi:hypothetical protein